MNNDRQVFVIGGKGIGFSGLLTILFIALKLMGYISWSWIWVLSPLWISFALALSIMVLTIFIIGLFMFIGWLASLILK